MPTRKGYKRISVVETAEENQGQLALGNSHHSTIIPSQELPLKFPHLIAVEQWLNTFTITPFVAFADSSPDMFGNSSKRVCENCHTMHTKGEPEFDKGVFEERELKFAQEKFGVCSETCAIETIFQWDTIETPSVEEISENFDYYTTIHHRADKELFQEINSK